MTKEVDKALEQSRPFRDYWYYYLPCDYRAQFSGVHEFEKECYKRYKLVIQ